MDKPTEVVVIEKAKAVVEGPIVVTEHRPNPDAGPDAVSLACPACHRRITVRIDKENRCVCSAIIIPKRG